MKASELIETLKLTIKQCGDHDVVISHYEKTTHDYVHIGVEDTAFITDDLEKRILIF